MKDRLGRGRGQMKMRYAAVASVATAILLLSACNGDDSSTTTSGPSTTASEATGATTIAKGEDVELVGDAGTAGQTLNINAEDPDFAAGDLVALIIREGDPDSVALRANDTGAASCTGLLKAIPDHLLTDDSNFADVQDGEDIQTS